MLPSANIAYDFATNACAATWFSRAGQLPCPGTDGDAKGLCSRSAIPNWKLEQPILGPASSPSRRTFRMDIFKVSSRPSECKMETVSDRSLTVKAARQIVMYAFRLDYQTGTDPIRTLFGVPSLGERYEGQYFSSGCRLKCLAGKDVKFILTVLAAGTAVGDRALWVGPIIYRAGASYVTPVATTAVPTTLTTTPTTPIATTAVPTTPTTPVATTAVPPTTAVATTRLRQLRLHFKTQNIISNLHFPRVQSLTAKQIIWHASLFPLLRAERTCLRSTCRSMWKKTRVHVRARRWMEPLRQQKTSRLTTFRLSKRPVRVRPRATVMIGLLIQQRTTIPVSVWRSSCIRLTLGIMQPNPRCSIHERVRSDRDDHGYLQ